jgi:hypothetical protein
VHIRDAVKAMDGGLLTACITLVAAAARIGRGAAWLASNGHAALVGVRMSVHPPRKAKGLQQAGALKFFSHSHFNWGKLLRAFSELVADVEVFQY